MFITILKQTFQRFPERSFFIETTKKFDSLTFKRELKEKLI